MKSLTFCDCELDMETFPYVMIPLENLTNLSLISCEFTGINIGLSLAKVIDISDCVLPKISKFIFENTNVFSDQADFENFANAFQILIGPRGEKEGQKGEIVMRFDDKDAIGKNSIKAYQKYLADDCKYLKFVE